MSEFSCLNCLTFEESLSVQDVCVSTHHADAVDQLLIFSWSDHEMYVAPWQNWFELRNSNRNRSRKVIFPWKMHGLIFVGYWVWTNLTRRRKKHFEEDGLVLWAWLKRKKKCFRSVLCMITSWNNSSSQLAWLVNLQKLKTTACLCHLISTTWHFYSVHL